jgi:alpha-L-fucosidase
VTEALQHGNADGAAWRPGEADVSIRPGWFHHEAENERVRSVENLFELYSASVGRNANLLLNVPPTREGLFHETDARRLAEFGGRLREAFAVDHAARARVHRSTEGVEFELREPAQVGTIVLREQIERGQAVARYRVEARVNGAWSVVSRGTTIGHKKIDRFPAVTAERVRVVIEESVGPVQLGDVGLFEASS